MPPLSALVFTAFTGLLLAAVYTDVRTHRIPNGITVGGMAVGILLGAVQQGGFPTQALAGAAVALVVSFPFFALGALGAGDAKLFAAVGTFVGPGALLPVAVYGALAGGVLALAHVVRRGVFLPVLVGTKDLAIHLMTLGRHGERRTLDTPGVAKIPYGVAIAVGALASWFFPYLPGGAP